ncbi:hypothetical protein KSS87_012743 [Heliosperma pusillum]|nr:hypothetical protein KSS87_012743 [Heliosperma pusillum]
MVVLRDGKDPGAAETTRSRNGTKLQDILMSDKPYLSYADFHHELTRNPDAPLPKYVGSKQSQLFEKRNFKEEELVKYMSNLPSYLERGKNYQEKALNVGVLDWRRLEKWQYSQKHMQAKNSAFSPSSSNASLFSTDDSSTHSSRDQICSPARQRSHCISLQSVVEASPKEDHVRDAKSSSGRATGRNCSPVRHGVQGSVHQSHPQKVYAGVRMSHEIDVFGGNTNKFKDSTAVTGNQLFRHKTFTAVCETRGSNLQSSKIGGKLISDKNEATPTWKGKKKIQDVESAKDTERFRETKLNAADRGYFGRDKSGVVIMPREPVEHPCTSFTGSASFTASDRLSIEPGEKFLDLESAKELGRFRETKLNAVDRGYFARDKSGAVIMPREPVEHPCTSFTGSASFTANDRLSIEPGEKFLLTRKNLEARCPPSSDICNQMRSTASSFQQESGVDISSRVSHISLQSTTNKLQTSSTSGVQGIKVPTEAPCVASFPARMLSSPSRSRHTPEKNPVTSAKPSEDLDARKTSESILKARNPSPIRRLSFAMGKMIKNVGSRDNSPLRMSNSREDCNVGSGSDATNPCLFIDNPCSNKLSNNHNNKGRSSSPLKRLLDPLLKPRVSNCSDPSNKQTSSSIGVMKSCTKPLDSRTGNSTGVQLRSAGATDAHDISKNGLSTLQALLQISFKNGLPLFTFAIDNEKNILAATVRKSSAPGKGHNSWIYTFFAIHEVKRKSGSWLTHRGKGGNHGYVPNVVAQMKVSDTYSSSTIKHDNADEAISREFDLFAVDLGQGDEYSTDFHPTNELAAIIVELPRITGCSDNKVDDSSFDWLGFSQGSISENSQVKRSNNSSLSSLNLSTTVVLPGGVHTVPSKGEISRLAQRWRSGGVCDCGGWDLGCQLRVYTNKKEHLTKFDSFGTCQNNERLQLFSQVGQDDRPVLNMAPFKERIYSVEFRSSLTLLQAFAVSISFIDCRRPSELSETNNIPVKVPSDVGVFEVPIRPKMSNQAEAPGRFVSYPPHSPVGRV